MQFHFLNKGNPNSFVPKIYNGKKKKRHICVSRKLKPKCFLRAPKQMAKMHM